MEYNLISNVESCYIQLPALLYYSHWPSIIISLLFGTFVFLKSNKFLPSKILFAITIVFSGWTIINLITWVTTNSLVYSFFWSFFEILAVLLFILILYFIYVFIEEHDVSFKTKLFFLIPFLPIVVLSPKYYLVGFNATICDAIMNKNFLYYIYVLKGALSLATIFLLVYFYFSFREDKIKKNKVILIGVGSVLFILSFLVTQYFTDLIFVDSYEVEFYGLFAMDIFIAFLAYLIVRFETFNIKMIGAQSLVIGLVVLIGSQFFFIKSFINQILTGITLILSIVFGWALIRSIKLEIERKNELQLMSDKLAQANDQLRKLDNAKSEFISIASHQLRTPLTAIKGFISLILEESYGAISTEVKDVLNKVYLSNERLIELVEDLLNLSRIESGRMEYKFEKTNLSEVCREVYDTFVLRAKEKDLTLDLVLPEDSKTEATTDRSKIREVISNMVDNALKYTVKGGVKMKIIETPVNVTVAIIDTGIGVPAEEIPYLFSKFSRGKDINRLNAGGTGLGLHVGRKVMEALHGRIWVESKGANLGSTFFLEIPKEHMEGNN